MRNNARMIHTFRSYEYQFQKTKLKAMIFGLNAYNSNTSTEILAFEMLSCFYLQGHHNNIFETERISISIPQNSLNKVLVNGFFFCPINNQ